MATTDSDGRTAIVLGATGLVGGACLDRLLDEGAYRRVVAPVRRPLGRTHAQLEAPVIDFDDIEAHAAHLRGDDLYACLGTTMRKAGSREAFYRVDHTYTVEAARVARREGVKRLLLVSALGADRGSLFYYNRVKGEIEEAVRELGFPELHVFRPSVLVGERSESRPGERAAVAVMRGLGFVLRGPLRRYRPVAAGDVARAMVQSALAGSPGMHVHESEALI